MSRSIIAGAACALCLAASPAAAEPFQNFIDMCLDTNLDRQAAGSMAKANGWIPLSLEGMDLGEDSLRDPVLYLSADPATVSDKSVWDIEMLMTGWGGGQEIFGIPGVRMDACVVMSESSDPATLRSRLQDWLDVEPVMLDGEEAWVFSRDGAGFRSEAALMDLGEEELPRLARDKKVFMAALIPEDGMAGLMLAIFRAD